MEWFTPRLFPLVIISIVAVATIWFLVVSPGRRIQGMIEKLLYEENELTRRQFHQHMKPIPLEDIVIHLELLDRRGTIQRHEIMDRETFWTLSESRRKEIRRR